MLTRIKKVDYTSVTIPPLAQEIHILSTEIIGYANVFSWWLKLFGGLPMALLKSRSILGQSY